MKNPYDLSQRLPNRPSKRQIIGIVVLLIIVVFLLSLRAMARFYTDFLWFKEVHYQSVFTGIIMAKITLAVIFSVAATIFVWLNLLIVRRLAPGSTFLRPQEEAVRKFREIMRIRGRLVNVAAAIVVGLMLGIPAYNKWQSWMLFRHAKGFAIKDSQFSRDVGFYVFKLPFVAFAVDWLFGLVLLTTLFMIALHYLYGSIQIQMRGQRATKGVRGHVSVLLGILALIKALDYYLQRYELNFSNRGFVSGAGFTDVHAVLPALNFLVLVSAFAAILFFVNVGLRRWSLPIIAVALWLVIDLLLAGIYPVFVQKVRVDPAQSSKEAPYITRNINATRQAFDLSGIDQQTYNFSNDVSSADLAADKSTLDNVRLWDPTVKPDQSIVAVNSFQRLQGVRPFYQLADTDVDRYTVNGVTTPVLISARELNPSALPSKTWENQVVAYTHGFGAVVAPFSQSTPDGDPQFDVKDIPVSETPGAPAITNPRIYFGDNLNGYVITNSKRQEIDYVDTQGNNANSTYTGKGGVTADNIFRRAAFALRFNDVNPLISSLVTSKSRFLYNRDIRLRVHTVAPFLQIDSDPYPVISNGRIVWMLDAYTTTSRYPYSQPADTSDLSSKSGLNTSFNYVRNSVKVTVDAEDGTTKLYVMDKTDPIIQTWQSVFPKLFTDGSQMPADLRTHIRYPEDMFKVQSTMWSSYHIKSAKDFYGKSDLWNLSQDPVGQTTPGFKENRMAPNYVYMQLPGQSQAQFVLMQSFVPQSENDTRRELVSFLVAGNDGSDYGKLTSYELPRAQLPPGPADIAQRIQSDPTVSGQQTLLNGGGNGGSTVITGNLLVIPIKDSFLYVQPYYVQGKVSSGTTPLPQLKKIAVVYGDKVSFQSTFQAALADVFSGQNVPTLSGNTGATNGPTTTPTQSTVSDLLQKASDDYAAAQTALKNGDLGTYKSKNDEAAGFIAQAQQLLSSAGTTTTTTAPK